MTRGFSSLHPAVNLLFFVGAVGLSMFISHPLYASCSLLMALGQYCFLNRGKSKAVLLYYGLMFLVVLLCNIVLNPLGETVLFRWIFDRPVTLEAIVYGVLVGVNFVAVMLWFSCYNLIMTTDKFTYLFGRFAPSVTLVLTMILRLIPLLKKKTQSIVAARNSIGKCRKSEYMKENLCNGMEVLSILTSCALEDAVVTADSMRSRGYVDSVHSNFLFYRWKGRDIAAGTILFLLMMTVLLSVAAGAAEMTYFPSLVFPETSGYTVIGFLSYMVFLGIPLLIDLWEEITWRILKSKI